MVLHIFLVILSDSRKPLVRSPVESSLHTLNYFTVGDKIRGRRRKIFQTSEYLSKVDR